MEYILENDFLKVTVTTWGAQVKSVVRKCDGVEHIWQADKAVWGYHAPILFPYCGRLKENKHIAKGQTYEWNAQHGFARTMEHEFVFQNKHTLVLQITDTPETLAVWPYKFRLMSAFTLEGDVLHHTLTVENQDEEELSFGIGFHPAFTLPFDENHTFKDYELRFDKNESPICLQMSPRGLVTGNTYFLGNNLNTIPVTEELFANDSHCFIGLQSDTLGLYEKDTGRAVICDISQFPYTLIWSKPGMPRFVCIEPWHSLPSPEGGSIRWEEKPAAAILLPGEAWSCTLSTTFAR
jgi:aldose 1-epimerase